MTAQEAREGEAWVQWHGGAYVDGAIQAPPEPFPKAA
jgi:hypothetical protein